LWPPGGGRKPPHSLSTRCENRNGVRTYLRVRMPTFTFSPNELRTLVRFFLAVSAQQEPYIKEQLEPLSKDERDLAFAAPDETLSEQTLERRVGELGSRADARNPLLNLDGPQRLHQGASGDQLHAPRQLLGRAHGVAVLRRAALPARRLAVGAGGLLDLQHPGAVAVEAADAGAGPSPDGAAIVTLTR